MKRYVYALLVSVATLLFCVCAKASATASAEATASHPPGAVSTYRDDAGKPRTPRYTLVGDAGQVTVPFEYAGNIHIPVTVDGHRMQFIFDSANIDSLSRQAAKAAGLAVQGLPNVKAEGGGPKLVNVGLAKIKVLTIDGKVTLRDQTLPVVPLPQGLSTKYPLDGTIGYGTLKHFVVRVDYVNHTLTFMQPGIFHPAHAGTAFPLTLYGDRLPVIAGSIDGLRGHFFVDTGASSFSLMLSSPFVEAHHLETRYRATPAMVSGISTGGALRTRAARGGAFRMGGLTVENPVVILSLSRGGFAASKAVDGDIGGRILSRFTITFDYPQGRIYLKPNQNYDQPMNYDQSGMAVLSVEKEHAGFSILGVMPGGPAAQAGLNAGDVITAVNGEPASDIGAARFAAMLRNDAPGTRVKLVVRDGKTVTTPTLVLRRLIPETGGLKKSP
ncbi:MAG: aspartyl protease family protein [Gammaproteobacteria bacterium]